MYLSEDEAIYDRHRKDGHVGTEAEQGDVAQAGATHSHQEWEEAGSILPSASGGGTAQPSFYLDFELRVNSFGDPAQTSPITSPSQTPVRPQGPPCSAPPPTGSFP